MFWGSAAWTMWTWWPSCSCTSSALQLCPTSSRLSDKSDLSICTSSRKFSLSSIALQSLPLSTWTTWRLVIYFFSWKKIQLFPSQIILHLPLFENSYFSIAKQYYKILQRTSKIARRKFCNFLHINFWKHLLHFWFGHLHFLDRILKNISIF